MPVIIVTTPTLEGKRITRYLGMVTGEASAEVTLVSDKPVAGFADTYHKAIPSVRDNALRGAIQGAEHVGANAIVGTTVNYIIHGSGKGMVLVSVTGTAVVIEDIV
ncbi:MAG: heavy metal-binding domain-containing protein [Gammaproteobacteria bacterium]|nr:heavy metal-binding domain-containing protein [Gammaproteobacteria bacterium]